MLGFSCSNCFFWVNLVSGSVSGECRRLPPQVVQGQLAGQSHDAIFPMTVSGNWCGGFQDLSSEWVRQMMQNVGREI